MHKISSLLCALKHFNKIDILFLLVVTQSYDTDVNKAYVIRGNSVVMKCETPSYVADFLTVISWHTDNGDIYYPGDNNGTYLIYWCEFSGLKLKFVSLY